MMKIYLISDTFQYEKMIASDAGPSYSENMLWRYDYIKNIGQYASYVNIIDARITNAECEYLEDYISEHKDTTFLLTITDPFEEYCRLHWYYKFLFRIKDFENVFFLTKYIPSEVVKDLDQQTNHKKMVFIPYPFADRYSISENLSARSHKIIVSGALEPALYPYRSKFYEAATSINPLNFVLRQNTVFLQHPNYPDIGRKLIHNIVGDKYIEHLSQFCLMLVTPSRCNLELLKYSECAYAKCVPIGKIPASFSREMKEPFLEIDFSWISRSIRYFLSIPISELSERSKQYYQAFEAERNPALLNSKLDSFLESIAKACV